VSPLEATFDVTFADTLQNSLMYFSATIFTMLGFSIPTLTSLVVAVTNFAFTLVALVYVDRVGRRRILLWSIPLMIVGLLLAGYGFSFIELSSSSEAPALMVLPLSSWSASCCMWPDTPSA